MYCICEIRKTGTHSCRVSWWIFRTKKGYNVLLWLFLNLSRRKNKKNNHFWEFYEDFAIFCVLNARNTKNRNALVPRVMIIVTKKYIIHSDKYVMFSHMPKKNFEIFSYKKVMKIKRIYRRSMCLNPSGKNRNTLLYASVITFITIIRLKYISICILNTFAKIFFKNINYLRFYGDITIFVYCVLNVFDTWNTKNRNALV